MLSLASGYRRNDHKVVLAAVIQDGRALQYASDDLRNSRQVVLAAVTQNQYALKYASEELQNDRQVVLAAVTCDGWALKYASEKLRNDRQVVLAAIRRDWCALEYASEALRNDRQVVLAAIAQNEQALYDASPELRHDRECLCVCAARKAIRNLTSLERHEALALAHVTSEVDTLSLLKNIVFGEDTGFDFAGAGTDDGASLLAEALSRADHIFRFRFVEKSLADVLPLELCRVVRAILVPPPLT